MFAAVLKNPSASSSPMPLIHTQFLYDPNSGIVTCFGCAVNRNKFLFHILLFTLLHISASTGHPQVKNKQSFLKAITPTTDPCLGHTVHY
jgi:hypothetical protein